METITELIRNLVYDDTETFLFQVYNILMKSGFFITYDWYFNQFENDLMYYAKILTKAAIIEFTIDSIALYFARHTGVKRFNDEEKMLDSNLDVKNQTTHLTNQQQEKNKNYNNKANTMAWM